MQPNLVHSGESQHSATCCATVTDLPRWVTFITSTPLVITSLRIDFAQQVAGDAYGDGAEAGKIADLLAFDGAALQCGVIDPDDRHGPRCRLDVRLAGGGCHVDERVERVGLARLAFLDRPIGLEPRIDPRCETGPEPGSVIERAAGVEVPCPFGVDELP